MEAPKLAVTMTDGNLTIPKGSWAKLLALAFAGQWVGAKEPGNERLGEKTSVLGFRLSAQPEEKDKSFGKELQHTRENLVCYGSWEGFLPLEGTWNHKMRAPQLDVTTKQSKPRGRHRKT